MIESINYSINHQSITQSMVTTTIENNIATITFSNPPHNALPGDILAGLANAIAEVGENGDVNVILLRSGGDRTFCAGASFDELMAVTDFDSGKLFFMGFANVINACRKCPKIIVARIQGKAVGGGVGLAAAADYCMATKYAAVKLSELSLGIGPFVVGPAVERKIGLSAMSQLTVDATQWYTAEWAEEKGLYAAVFDSIALLDSYLEQFLKQLAQSNPEALQELKRSFWQDCDDWDNLLAERAAISGRLVLSEFTRQAIERFKSGKSANE